MSFEIINADCLLAMKDLPDNSIDLIFCDLPYGTTACKWDIIIPFEPLWEQYKRIVKKGRAIVLFGAQPFTSKLVMSNIEWFKYEWIWNKKCVTGQLNAKKQPLRQHESILVFYENNSTFNPIMHTNKLKRSFEGKLQKQDKSECYGAQKEYISTVKDNISYPRSIIEQTSIVGNSSEKVAHPTQKPVALAEYIIKTYTNEGDLVLDNCMGSGTTLVACENLGRNSIGIELDPEYCKIAEARIKNVTKNQLF